jgi:hypothetical protein
MYLAGFSMFSSDVSGTDKLLNEKNGRNATARHTSSCHRLRQALRIVATANGVAAV